jgi:hypothetical protein
MTAESSRNLAQSIHQQLKNKARERKEDPNLVLIRYALERFLYRFGCSRYQDRFILKGAMLFAAWTSHPLVLGPVFDRAHVATRPSSLRT